MGNVTPEQVMAQVSLIANLLKRANMRADKGTALACLALAFKLFAINGVSADEAKAAVNDLVASGWLEAEL